MNDIDTKDNELDIVSTTIDHINTSHAEFVELGERNSERLVAQINKAREIGIALIAEKARCRHGGGWALKFRHNGRAENETAFVFDFDIRTGQNYMRVARALPEPITSLPEGVRVLTDVYRGMGVIPNAESTSSSPQLEQCDRASSQAHRLISILSKWKEREPIAEWSPQQREALRDQLQPLVELYNELEGAA